jgi:hypothetical protein
MVPSIPPSATSRSGYESLFRHAFTTNRYIQFSPTGTPTDAANEVCGDVLRPDFDGLYVWLNNVNTLSLANDLEDLHELCRQFKHYNIGIAALQELNIAWYDPDDDLPTSESGVWHTFWWAMHSCLRFQGYPIRDGLETRFDSFGRPSDMGALRYQKV